MAYPNRYNNPFDNSRPPQRGTNTQQAPPHGSTRSGGHPAYQERYENHYEADQRQYYHQEEYDQEEYQYEEDNIRGQGSTEPSSNYRGSASQLHGNNYSGQRHTQGSQRSRAGRGIFASQNTPRRSGTPRQPNINRTGPIPVTGNNNSATTTGNRRGRARRTQPQARAQDGPSNAEQAISISMRGLRDSRPTPPPIRYADRPGHGHTDDPANALHHLHWKGTNVKNSDRC